MIYKLQHDNIICTFNNKLIFKTFIGNQFYIINIKYLLRCILYSVHKPNFIIKTAE